MIGSCAQLIDTLQAGAVSVCDVAHDSRQVVPGGLFFAYPGMVVDGRRYIADAIHRGARVIVYDAYDTRDGYCIDPSLSSLNPEVLFFPATAVRTWIGEFADYFFGNPSRHLTVIGVTGTNGKTSVSHFIAQALPECAVLGTLGNGRLGDLQPSSHTTLDAISLHRYLNTFKNRGITRVAMEVSSHALDQSRIAGMYLDTAVFTQISRDHLDYHKTMEAYGLAKAALFQHPGLQRAVINREDALGRTLIAKHGHHLDLISYAIDPHGLYPVLSDRFLTVQHMETTDSRTRVILQTSWGEGELWVPLLGRFNVSNVLAALGVLLHQGVDFHSALLACAALKAVPGRMQCFGGAAYGCPRVVVDYAHTPDALEKVLATLNETTAGQLWCVFGCGGDRDRGKRAIMGEVAARLAHRVIVTSDNPRSEAPQDIAAEILAGMPYTSSVSVILDRAEAILFALQNATEHDTVLLAGKGHETTQIIGGTLFTFDDAEYVRAWLGKLEKVVTK